MDSTSKPDTRRSRALAREFAEQEVNAAKKNGAMGNAAARLVSTIDNTGGIISYPNGTFAPVGDEEWIDLGDAYIAACAELGRGPKIAQDLRQREDPEIMRVLVLSSAHIIRETMDEIEAANGTARFVGSYGVIVFVPETNDEETDDLAIVFDFCRKHGYEWVRFDSDGRAIDGLPVYDWE